MGLQDGSVEWINHEPNVYEFLETIDLFIITSKYEGFGLVVLEAMQSNIPIVASRISPFEEILGSDFSTLCNVGEMNEFLDAVLYLASPTMRQEILNVQNVRLELFSPELMNEKMNTVYESISSN